MDGERHFPQDLTMPEKVSSTSRSQPEGGIFLCVVDESEELWKALRFACRRAAQVDGRVGLLYVVEPAEFQHWLAVAELMRDERREEAEETLQKVATAAQKLTGSMPVLYIREGEVNDELIKLIDEHTEITSLILGAATGLDGPGPIVSYLVQKKSGRLRVPITIVPGMLSDEQIDAIT
jgi:nucleotide-binding universal stress UspA family protein